MRGAADSSRNRPQPSTAGPVRGAGRCDERLYSILMVWKLLDSFGRPPLLSHLRACALELNQHGLGLLRDGAGADADRARSLLATVSAGAACWRALQPVLEEGPWRTVKATLGAQRRLLGALNPVAPVMPAAALCGIVAHARSARERHSLARLIRGFDRQDPPGLAPTWCHQLERTLLEQSCWLTDLPAGPEPEAGLRLGVVGIYRKARVSGHRDPASGRARRRLSALMWIEQLMGGRVGPILDGRVPPTAAGRLWMGLEEDHWLRLLPGTDAFRSLRGKDAQCIARPLRRRRRKLVACNRTTLVEALAESVEEFTARLPWRVFLSLAEQPSALNAGKGEASI